jgi:hypothetical protein
VVRAKCQIQHSGASHYRAPCRVRLSPLSFRLYSAMMPWDRRFGVPIALLDGRTIATLSDARAVLLTVAPTARRGALWRYLSQLLVAAAADRASMIEVEEMLLRGLNAERMI